MVSDISTLLDEESKYLFWKIEYERRNRLYSKWYKSLFDHRDEEPMSPKEIIEKISKNERIDFQYSIMPFEFHNSFPNRDNGVKIISEDKVNVDLDNF